MYGGSTESIVYGMEHKVLLIVNNSDSRRLLGELLGAGGYIIACLYDVDLAQATIGLWARQFNLVIIDEGIGDRSGLELMQQALAERADLPVIIMQQGKSDGSLRATQKGAAHYVTYAVDPNVFTAMVDSVLRRPRSTEQVGPSTRREVRASGRLVSR